MATLERDEALVAHVALDREPGDPAVLSADERARWERMRSHTKRREFLVGRTALRTTLGALLGVPPRDLRFEYGPHGKPLLAQHPALHFNLSHSGDRAVVVVCRRGPVGVDIEALRPSRPFRRLADRFFAPPEADWLASLPAAAQRNAFYRMWTLKEGYLKAIGTGLTLSSRAFVIDAGVEPAQLVETPADQQDASAWTLHEVSATAGYVAALCTPTSVVHYREVSVPDITGGSP